MQQMIVLAGATTSSDNSGICWTFTFEEGDCTGHSDCGEGVTCVDLCL